MIGDPGAYRLLHKPTGRFYVGSSNSVMRRINEHRYCLLRGDHQNPKLNEVFTTWADFEITIWVAATVEEAMSVEQSLLDTHAGTELCCNVSLTAFPDRVGERWGADHRNRIHRSMIGRTHTPDTKALISLTRSRRVSINGTIYDSAAIAANKLGLPHKRVRNRLMSDSPSFKEWKFIDDEVSV